MRLLIQMFAVFLAGLLLGFSAVGEVNDFSNTKEKNTRWAGFVEPTFPFFSSVVDARSLGEGWPTNNLTPRGIVLNPGNGIWACFDTDLLRMSVIWFGAGVTPVSMSQASYHVAGVKAPEGQGKLPEIIGTPWLVNGIYPGWQIGGQVSLNDPREPGPDPAEVGRGPLPPMLGQFKSVRLNESGVQLEYTVGGTRIQENVETRLEKNQPVVQRYFRLDIISQPLWLALGRQPKNSTNKLDLALSSGPSRNVQLAEAPDGLRMIHILPSKNPIEFSVAMSLNAPAKTWKPTKKIKPVSSANQRWPETVTTSGKLSPGNDAYVTDPVSLPWNNPWRRNLRLADLTFFNDGRAAAVTFDGDVWMISGLAGDLREVRWKRFASGLHEPMGICVRDEALFVFDRNGIWQLRDTDGNGEADVHELFSNAFAQTAETREFSAGLRVLPDGAFVIGKGGQQGSTIGKQNGTVLRISADGKSVEVLGWGLRQPFLGAHPKTGLVTVSDQQGHYVPATPLHIIRDRQYYGYLSLKLPKEKYPAPIAEPLTWIPHAVNPSGAGQVWLHTASMGPLKDALIHIGYNRPELFLVLMNSRGESEQAAVISLTRDLAFAPLFGAINPADGGAWFTGFQIWGTTAKEISGLARLRYTGQSSVLPQEIVPMDQGVLLKFNEALDDAHAVNISNFSAESWHYKRAATYGSPHFKEDDSTGQDSLLPSSAYISRDGRSVFVGIPGMKPVAQMRFGWKLAFRNGKSVEQNAFFTVRELLPFKPEAENFEPLTVNLAPAVRNEIEEAPITAAEGKRLAETLGCLACHSTDGSLVGKIGPSFKGLFGNERILSDGTRLIADESYVRESILNPSAKVTEAFAKLETGMPSYEGVISDGQLESLILFIQTLR